MYKQTIKSRLYINRTLQNLQPIFYQLYLQQFPKFFFIIEILLCMRYELVSLQKLKFM